MVAVKFNTGASGAWFDMAPRDLLACTRYEAVNGEHYIDIETTRELERGWLVGLRSDVDGVWREYQVWSVSEPHDGDLITRTYRCVWSLQGILSAVPSDAMPSGTAANALTQLLRNQSAIEIGTVERTTTGSASFWRMSAWDGLAELVKVWGGEVVYRGGVGAQRYIDLVERQGSQGAFSYIYGSAAIERITRTWMDGAPVCRIIPLGAATQTDSGGNGRKIDITSVNGGVPYLEDAEAAALYADSPYQTPTAYVENSDMKTPTELLAWGQAILEGITQARPEYTVDLTESSLVGAEYVPMLGDTGTVVDRDLGVELEARVVAVKYDELAGTCEATISTADAAEGALASLIGRSTTLGGVSTNGYVDVAGRVSYPLYVYGSLPAAANVPISPCFVLDASDNSLWHFDGATRSRVANRITAASGNAYFTAERTDTQTVVQFGVGSGGTNHGVYSNKANGWLIHSNGENVYVNGKRITSMGKGLFFATPSGADGDAALRALVPADMPGETVTEIANVFAANSGVTVSAVSYVRWGKAVNLQITFSSSAAIADKAQITLGTIAAGKRPAAGAVVGSGRYIGNVGTNGVVYIRNVQGSQIAAGTSTSVWLTYLLP